MSQKTETKKKKPETKPKLDNIYFLLKAVMPGRIVIVARNGLIYEGTLTGFAFGFLVLSDAVVKGTKYTAKVDTLYVKLDMVQHIHPEPRELIANA